MLRAVSNKLGFSSRVRVSSSTYSALSFQRQFSTENGDGVAEEEEDDDEAKLVKFYPFLEIPKYRKDPEHLDRVLKGFIPLMKRKSNKFLGYQATNDLPPIDPIADILEIHMNNAGDPFYKSYVRTSCQSIERAVLRYCAELWNDDPRNDLEPNDAENFWGYVLNMGSTEGNLNALWNAREKMDEESAGHSPIVLLSDDAHYSLQKSCDVLALESCNVTCDDFGRVLPEVLLDCAEKYAKLDRPIITVYNMGTVFKGSYDNCQAHIPEMQSQVFDKYGVPHWNHLDGALGGFIIPHLQMGIKSGVIERDTQDSQAGNTDFVPQFGFDFDVQSCNASFYKWYGAPYPCAVFMTQNKYLRDADTPDYIGSPDTTLGGGRNAFTSLYMWWRLSLTDYGEEVRDLKKCLDVAEYLRGNLQSMDEELGGGLVDVQRAPYSLSVTFNSPSQRISNKYSIPQETDSNTGLTRSHIYTMKHVDEALIDEFCDDYRKFLVEGPKKQTK